MNYPSTYLLMKASCCHFLACKHDAECGKCEFGEIRKQAAKDEDEKFSLRNALRKCSDTLRLVLENAEDVMQPHLVQEIEHCGSMIEKTLKGGTSK